MGLSRKELIAQKLLLRGKKKKVISSAHVCSLEERAKNAHDQDEHENDVNMKMMNMKMKMMKIKMKMM